MLQWSRNNRLILLRVCVHVWVCTVISWVRDGSFSCFYLEIRLYLHVCLERYPFIGTVCTLVPGLALQHGLKTGPTVLCSCNNLITACFFWNSQQNARTWCCKSYGAICHPSGQTQADGVRQASTEFNHVSQPVVEELDLSANVPRDQNTDEWGWFVRCSRVMFVSFTIKHDHYLNLREILWRTLPATAELSHVGMETVSSRKTGQKTHSARGESELMFPKLCGGMFGT